MTDTAGRRWSDWITLPTLIPINRAFIQHVFLPGPGQNGRISLSIDPARYEIMNTSPPGYQVWQSTFPNQTLQAWAKNVLLAGVTMAQGQPWEMWNNFPSYILFDRRVDSLWVDQSSSGGGPDDVCSWGIGWDDTTATTLNNGVPQWGAWTGWQTCAGLIIGDSNGVPGWGGYTAAITVQAGIQTNGSTELCNTGGTQARVTFAAGSQQAATIVAAYIGVLNQGTMTQIKCQ